MQLYIGTPWNIALDIDTIRTFDDGAGHRWVQGTTVVANQLKRLRLSQSSVGCNAREPSLGLRNTESFRSVVEVDFDVLIESAGQLSDLDLRVVGDLTHDLSRLAWEVHILVHGHSQGAGALVEAAEELDVLCGRIITGLDGLRQLLMHHNVAGVFDIPSKEAVDFESGFKLVLDAGRQVVDTPRGVVFETEDAWQIGRELILERIRVGSDWERLLERRQHKLQPTA